jgi:hypothetical protein
MTSIFSYIWTESKTNFETESKTESKADFEADFEIIKPCNIMEGILKFNKDSLKKVVTKETPKILEKKINDPVRISKIVFDLLCCGKFSQEAIDFTLIDSDIDDLSMNNLGFIYKNHFKNIPKAFECYTKSAEKGNHYAMYNLGCLHLDEIGYQDTTKSIMFFKKSADLGNTYAIHGFLNRL